MNLARLSLTIVPPASLIAAAAILQCGPSGVMVSDGGPPSASDAGLRASCPHARYIAFNDDWATGESNFPCKDVSGDGGVWKASILFSSEEATGNMLPPAGPPAEWTRLPPALQPYCAFTWQSTSAPEDPSALATGKTTAAPDCQIVSPVDEFSSAACDRIPGVNAATTCAPLWKTARAAIEATGTIEAGATPIQVVVVDTTRTGPSADPEALSPHGNAVGAIVEDIACGAPAPCSVSVRWQLGLPHTDDGGTDYVRGGLFGSIGEIAVAAWAATSQAPAPKTLVNLSVGWVHDDVPADAGAVMLDGAALSVAESAVLQALTYASCHGAVLLAAAGNESSTGSLDRGPLSPAAWEALPAPRDCSSYSAPFLADATGPLLSAVGGIDAYGRWLANARPGGHPRLAAYGAGVAAPTAGPSAYSPILTGSSIAVAMASGVAAATWGSTPSLTQWQIPSILYTQGVDLGVNADFPDPTQHVHRISLCRELGDSNCGQTGVDLAAISPVHGRVPINATSCAAGVSCPVFSGLANSTDEPWGFPQPGGNQCAACFLSMHSNRAVLDAVLTAPIVQPAVVTLTGSDGTTSSFALEATDASSVHVDLGATDMPAAAVLSIPAGDPGSTYDPIFVLPEAGAGASGE